MLTLNLNLKFLKIYNPAQEALLTNRAFNRGSPHGLTVSLDTESPPA